MVDTKTIINDGLVKYTQVSKTMAEEMNRRFIHDADYLETELKHETPPADLIREFKGYYKSWDVILNERMLTPPNTFSIGPTLNDLLFEAETYSIFYKRCIEFLEPLSKAKRGRPKSEAYTFENLFISIEARNELLNAAVQAGLIEQTDTGNGYRWIEAEGEKGHRVRAFWKVAIEKKMIKRGRTNIQKIAESIRVFFSMEAIGPNVLGEGSTLDIVYITFHRDLIKKLQ